jgi:S1-C subfamily serine protease
VVYDAQRGLIVTNNHVLENANDITVTLTDGRKLKAKRIGGDPDFDLAVISVPAEKLTAIPFGDSRQLEVGDFVLAIGYPGNIGQSVTSGIVSGLHRSNIGVEEFENFIQTDAAIYPGNSGGALVDLQGDLVGINTAFIGATSSNPGMGFAIPVNTARIVWPIGWGDANFDPESHNRLTVKSGSTWSQAKDEKLDELIDRIGPR